MYELYIQRTLSEHLRRSVARRRVRVGAHSTGHGHRNERPQGHATALYAPAPARIRTRGVDEGHGGLGDGRGRGRARGLRLAPGNMERGSDAVSRPGALSKQARRARPALQQDHEVPRHCHNNKRKHTHTHVQMDLHDTGSQTTWGF